MFPNSSYKIDLPRSFGFEGPQMLTMIPDFYKLDTIDFNPHSLTLKEASQPAAGLLPIKRDGVLSCHDVKGQGRVKASVIRKGLADDLRVNNTW